MLGQTTLFCPSTPMKSVIALSLAEALALFRRLGVNVEIMTRDDFKISYYALAKRYHPDRNPRNAELMANINAARAVVLKSHQNSTF
jgi:DnaJ-class molecular chaperone